MTTAAELREALERPPFAHWKTDDNRQRVILDAARTIALPILEADPELVERIAEFLWKLDNGGWSMLTSYARAVDDTKDYYREKAQELLAALITTDGEA